MRSIGVQFRLRSRITLVAMFVLTVTALGALQCRAWSGAPNADGISYLELAHGYAEGRFGVITNGYWSPLYPGGGDRVAMDTR